MLAYVLGVCVQDVRTSARHVRCRRRWLRRATRAIPASAWHRSTPHASVRLPISVVSHFQFTHRSTVVNTPQMDKHRRTCSV